MALTDAQLNEIEYQSALAEAQTASHTIANEKQRRADILRQAQAIVFENRRLLTASEASDVTAADVTAIADTLMAYVNG